MSLHAVTIAVTWVWLGMVFAISFIEAPLKFRAPGLTLPVGLGIGRLVFRALNLAELLFALVTCVGLLLAPPGPVATGALGGAVLLLAVQLIGIRPRLNRRTDAVLAGAPAPRSKAHHAYVATEVLKVVALVIGGVGLLTMIN
ncbi:hypothetical protein [Microlunatus sp. Y2014]|uniref:hypothetical protein n=1 Tax=Microlunatus sp. Y2014 TaxID=3418488 RepID=UPI003DA7128A